MHRVKAADLVAARELIALAGPEAEHAMLDRLPPELHEVYRSARSDTWLALDQLTPMYEAAAAVLFPTAPDALVQLGKAMARRSSSRGYRFLLSVAPITFMVRRAPRRWAKVHTEGWVTVESVSRQGGIVSVRGVPDVPRPHRDVFAGALAFLAESCGGKSVRILPDERDPNAWRWIARWG